MEPHAGFLPAKDRYERELGKVGNGQTGSATNFKGQTVARGGD